jgi:NOL1/NOP2/fmu family ribosome biogenesis protein
MRRAREVVARFGLPQEVLSRLALLEDQETIFVGTPEVMEFDAVRPLRRGIRFCRLFPHSVKPTTFAVQVLGREATRNAVEVDDVAAKELINGGDVRVDAEADDGFVIIKWRGFPVGVGVYRKPVLRSQIPRIRAVE